MFQIIFTYLIFFIMISCKHSDRYKWQIRQVDSLLLMLDTNSLIIKNCDTSKIRESKNNMLTEIHYFEKNNVNPIANETNEVLVACGNSIKPFDIILKEWTETIELMEESAEQLKNLKHDLLIGKMKEELARAYLQEELIIAQKAYFRVKELSSLINYATEIYLNNYQKLVETNKGKAKK